MTLFKHPYLDLVRPANVLTAAADVAAGFAVAGGPGAARHAVWLVLAGCSLYAGGIVLNDVCDRHLDARERPERPIPSGRVPAWHAAFLAAALLTGGVLCAHRVGSASTAMAVLLAATIVVYDAGVRRQPWAGPLCMGACRALNLLLGVSVVTPALATRGLVAVVPWLYVAAVTRLSQGEVTGASTATVRAAGGLMGGAFVALVLAVLLGPGLPVQTLPFAGLLAMRVIPAFGRAVFAPTAPAVRRAVGCGVLGIAFLDAALAAAFGGIGWGAGILILAAGAGRLARRFAVT